MVRMIKIIVIIIIGKCNKKGGRERELRETRDEQYNFHRQLSLSPSHD